MNLSVKCSGEEGHFRWVWVGNYKSCWKSLTQRWNISVKSSEETKIMKNAGLVGARSFRRSRGIHTSHLSHKKSTERQALLSSWLVPFVVQSLLVMSPADCSTHQALLSFTISPEFCLDSCLLSPWHSPSYPPSLVPWGLAVASSCTCSLANPSLVLSYLLTQEEVAVHWQPLIYTI